MYSDNTQKVKPAPSSMLEAALDLIARKINPVPISYPSETSRGKKPIGEEWQSRIITAEEAPRYFGNGKVNLGGQMGHTRMA